MSNRVYMYTRYERIWHWLQAAVIIALMLTGLEIHAPGSFHLLGFETSADVHKVLGFLLIANAVLGLFYHLTTGAIRQYFASSQDFLPLAVRQTSYYLHGIFHGAPYPFEKRPEMKLNPLQRITYLVILNVLLPLQVLTGLLLWGAQRWPDVIGRMGGLAALAAVHTMGSWIFIAFVVGHVYLTTTGHTPLGNIKAMITGWETVE